jgi:hypothetical protein
MVSTTTSTINNAIAISNPTLLMQTLFSVVAYVNNVACNVAIACNILHRFSCTTTTNTCGSCLQGFVSINNDDSNVACVSITETSFNNNNVAVVGEACNTNAQCIAKNCVDGYCEDVLKTCVNNCNRNNNNNNNGGGECVYMDNSIENKVVENCYEMDATCFAYCKCFDGFYGVDCSITSKNVFNSFVNLRELTCRNILKTLFLQDVSTVDFLLSFLTTISNVFTDTTQVSSVAFNDCSRALIDVIVNNPDLVCVDATVAQKIVTTISNVLNYNSSAIEFKVFFSNLTVALNTLTSSCYTELLLIGEDYFFVNSKNMRLTVHLTNKKLFPNATYVVAQENFEKINKIKTSTVKFKNISLLSEDNSVNNINNNKNFAVNIVGISILQFNSNPNKVLSNSSVLTIQNKLVSSTL